MSARPSNVAVSASCRVLVVDDEPLARERILELLEDLPDIEVLKQCTDGREAVTAIRELAPDLVFLDIRMPRLDGFGVVRKIGPTAMPAVIFVTAFGDHAIEAFDVHAVDYLLKPFEDRRFYAALGRARLRLASSDHPSVGLEALLRRLEPTEAPTYLERILIKQSGRVMVIPVDEVVWLGAEDVYVRVYAKKHSYLVRGTLSDFASQLDPSRFVRIHRSTIVRLAQVRSLEEHMRGDYVAVLADGTRLKVSRSRRTTLEHQLQTPGSKAEINPG